MDSSEHSVPEEHPHLSAEVTEVGQHHETDLGQNNEKSCKLAMLFIWDDQEEITCTEK